MQLENSVTKNWKSLFIVDDNEIDLWLALKIVEENNLSEITITAKNGADALRKLNDFQNQYNLLPEVFLIDAQMPLVDGFELIKKIKNSPLYFEHLTTIILVSADFEIEDFKKLNNIQVDNVLIKPLDKEQLTSLLYTKS
jgi:CheY-like chemotaxis protein